VVIGKVLDVIVDELFGLGFCFIEDVLRNIYFLFLLT
jgi:hypothetical protein